MQHHIHLDHYYHITLPGVRGSNVYGVVHCVKAASLALQLSVVCVRKIIPKINVLCRYAPERQVQDHVASLVL